MSYSVADLVGPRFIVNQEETTLNDYTGVAFPAGGSAELSIDLTLVDDVSD